MAGNGLTLVDAINEVVETIGEFPMTGTAPAATGTSIYSRARAFIERESTRVQSEGWPENTEMNRKFTLDSGKVDLSGEALDILRVRGAGPDSHRSLVLRTDSGVLKIFDADQRTFDLRDGGGGSSRADVFVDVTIEHSFENLSPQLKDVIVAQSKLAFQRRLQGNPNTDLMLQQELAIANRSLDRNSPEIEQPFNVVPQFDPMQQKQRQRQG